MEDHRDQGLTNDNWKIKIASFFEVKTSWSKFSSSHPLSMLQLMGKKNSILLIPGHFIEHIAVSLQHRKWQHRLLWESWFLIQATVFSTGRGKVSSLLILQMCQQKEGLPVKILSVTIFKVLVNMWQVLCEATMPKASGAHGIAPSTWSPLMLTQCLHCRQCSSEGLGYGSLYWF